MNILMEANLKLDDMPELGTAFAGNYELLSVLGSGASSIVYKAQQKSLEREVALKIFRREHFMEERARKRFTAEAQAVSNLDHPNIAYGVASGVTSDGYAFIAQEFVEGATLEQTLVQQKCLDPDSFRMIFGQVLDALEYAHQNGIVHRDIKPSNLLITESGAAKIVDFGIAKILMSETDAGGDTTTGAIVGSPDYMSPEQAKGATIDHRCDIYSLGAVMFHCLCGRKPFEADTPMHVMYMHSNEQAPPLKLPAGSSLNEQKLNRMLQKCLAKRPEDRYQNISELREELFDACAILKMPSGQRKSLVLLSCVVMLSSLLLLFIYFTKIMQRQDQASPVNAGSQYRPSESLGVSISNDPEHLLRKGNEERDHGKNGDLESKRKCLRQSIAHYQKAIQILKNAKKPNIFLLYTAHMGYYKTMEEMVCLGPDSQESMKMRTEMRELLLNALKLIKKDWNYERAFIYRELGTNDYALGKVREAEENFKMSCKLKEMSSKLDLDLCPEARKYELENDIVEKDTGESLESTYEYLAHISLNVHKNKRAAKEYYDRLFHYVYDRGEHYVVIPMNFHRLACYVDFLRQEGQRREALGLADRLYKSAQANEDLRYRSNCFYEIAVVFHDLKEDSKAQSCLSLAIADMPQQDLQLRDKCEKLQAKLKLPK